MQPSLKRGLELIQLGITHKMIKTGLAIIAVLITSFGEVQAQSPYPNKPVTIVVAYAPGGLGDLLARQMAEKLSIKTKQSFIVENKPGATGALGSRYVAKANPDGYTLLLGQTGELAITPAVTKDLGYNPLKDFRPIALIGEVPLIMVTSNNSPFKNLAEFIKAAKAKPGGMTYASSGSATPGHLAAAALCQGVGIDLVHAPYKGAGPAMTDVLGGHVDVFFSSAPSVIPQIQSKNLTALAISSSKRMPTLPEVRTVSEDELKGFNFTLWGGLLAPAGTPDAVINFLNSAINSVLEEPAFKNPLEKDGILIHVNSSKEFDEFIKRESIKYSQLVKAIGIQAE